MLVDESEKNASSNEETNADMKSANAANTIANAPQSPRGATVASAKTEAVRLK